MITHACASPAALAVLRAWLDEAGAGRAVVGGLDPSPLFRVGVELAGVDVDGLDRAGLDVVVEQARRGRAFFDHLDVHVARRASTLAAEGRSESADGVLADHGRRSSREAQAAAGRATVCTAMPEFETALGAAAVSSGHVDAVATATRTLTEEQRDRVAAYAAELVDTAASTSVEEFSRHVRHLIRDVTADEAVTRLEAQKRQNRFRHRVDRDTGLHHFGLTLDPENAARVLVAHRAHLATVCQRDGNSLRPWDELSAEAAVELITTSRASHPRVPDVQVLIDYDTLLHGLYERSVCETDDGDHLPVATVRRLCCEARIVPTVMNGAGETLDVGRDQRVANRAQRRALRAMHRTCGLAECTVPFEHCQIHHVIAWERHGPTDLDNLIPLCSRHHHLVHEGGWTLTLHPHRRITLTRPDGVVHFDGVTTDRQPPRPPDPCQGRRRRQPAA